MQAALHFNVETMADEEAPSDGKVRKQEEDYTKEVDDALPKAVAQATVRPKYLNWKEE